MDWLPSGKIIGEADDELPWHIDYARDVNPNLLSFVLRVQPACVVVTLP